MSAAEGEQSGASKRVSPASEQANGRVSGPVLQFVFLVVLDHSGIMSAIRTGNEDINQKKYVCRLKSCMVLKRDCALISPYKSRYIKDECRFKR